MPSSHNTGASTLPALCLIPQLRSKSAPHGCKRRQQKCHAASCLLAPNECEYTASLWLQVFREDQPSALLAMVPNSGNQLLLQRTAVPPNSPDVMGPRPLPLAIRAMSVVASFTADRIEPADVKVRANLASACVSYQQARLLVGYNKRGQSYVVGVAASGATWPQQPRVRAATCDAETACGDVALTAAGANPTQAEGAFVNGPSVDRVYSDVRTDFDHSGTSIVNSSPLLLLAAAHQRMQLKPRVCLAMGEGIRGV
jgi:hypothetical protein